MRIEHDNIGEIQLPSEALYGIQSARAKENFFNSSVFNRNWYMAVGIVKLACYNIIEKFKKAAEQKYPQKIIHLNVPSFSNLELLKQAAVDVVDGKYFDNFIIPAVQGGAGTSINMNINEIIANAALLKKGLEAGCYSDIDPVEDANCFQSTNDVIPTALKVAIMKLLNELEESVNNLREKIEAKEKMYRNVPRMGYTQLQQAVPSTYGMLFSNYNDALSRDWWRISKCFERIKTVNLGGGAIGTGVTIPRYFIMEVVPELKRLTGLPVTQNENLTDNTSNLDSYVEVHAILKAHAVNLEKIANDLRLLAADISCESLKIPAKQKGSSIMPGKVNPVIAEYIISASHKIYSNDMLVSNMCGQGQFELNAYLPVIGNAILETLELLISMNRTLDNNMITGLSVDIERSEKEFYMSPAICTVLVPYIGYNKVEEMVFFMKNEKLSVFEANSKLALLSEERIKEIMKPALFLQKGFSLKDI